MMNNQERENYFYVRDYIQKPTLTAAQIKEKVKSILCESGVNGDIKESFSNPNNDIEMVLMDFNKSGWGYYERTLMNTLQDELNEWLLIEISKVNEEFFMNEKYADGFANFGGEIENEIMIDIFDGETYITIAEWKQMLSNISDTLFSAIEDELDQIQHTIYEKETERIIVIDSLMGSGKTSWAFQELFNKNLDENIRNRSTTTPSPKTQALGKTLRA